ncbi:MAG: radical SAM protein [Candidatus Thermoplasmatota archaeon]|jgi:anaerobic magnesium-protoporphyrin IX monomethyl ester cyclase|nr:radical SAM protein [Candidatus Thermoplasmatota archaeon]
MNLLLINPPMDYNLIKKEYSFEAYMPPLGLLYLASPLEKKGHKVTLIDFIAEKYDEEKLKKEVLKVDIIGITITSQVASSAKKIVDLIKRFQKNKIIIIGGPHCTIQKEKVLEEINADIAVIGDGEKVIIEIVEALKEKKDLSNIHGIFYRHLGEIKSGLPPIEIEDLDSLDFPDRSLIKHYSYGKKTISGVTFFAKGKITTIITTRGCPFNCRFCVSKTLFKKCRLRTAENVVNELVEISKDYDSVFVVDDNFLIDKKRAYKIMDLLIEKKLDLDIWISGVRVTDADEELFKKMKKAGVKSLEFGIESGNQDVLDYYNKKITLEQVKKAVKLSKKIGFLTVGNFILGAPIETDKHIKDTVLFAKKLNLDFAFFYGFYFLKGSELWEEAYNQGKIKENEMFIQCDSRRGLCHFTPEELRKKLHTAVVSYYITPKYIISQFIRSIFIYKHFRVFKAGLKLLIEQKEETLFANR